jgi:hypothetical protein
MTARIMSPVSQSRRRQREIQLPNTSKEHSITYLLMLQKAEQ